MRTRRGGIGFSVRHNPGVGLRSAQAVRPLSAGDPCVCGSCCVCSVYGEHEHRSVFRPFRGGRQNPAAGCPADNNNNMAPVSPAHRSGGCPARFARWQGRAPDSGGSRETLPPPSLCMHAPLLARKPTALRCIAVLRGRQLAAVPFKRFRGWWRKPYHTTVALTRRGPALRGSGTRSVPNDARTWDLVLGAAHTRPRCFSSVSRLGTRSTRACLGPEISSEGKHLFGPHKGPHAPERTCRLCTALVSLCRNRGGARGLARRCRAGIPQLCRSPESRSCSAARSGCFSASAGALPKARDPRAAAQSCGPHGTTDLLPQFAPSALSTAI